MSYEYYIRVYISPEADTEDFGCQNYFYPRPSEPTTYGANDAQRSEKVRRDSRPSQANGRYRFRTIDP